MIALQGKTEDDYTRAVFQLFKALDDIDTASDIAKGDDAWYRRRVRHILDNCKYPDGFGEEEIDALYDVYYGPKVHESGIDDADS